MDEDILPFNPVTVTKVACNSNHSLCIAVDNGKAHVYGWGRNNNNCLDLSPAVIEALMPVKIPYFGERNPFMVACGQSFSMVICNDTRRKMKTLYGFGSGGRGRLGGTRDPNAQVCFCILVINVLA